MRTRDTMIVIITIIIFFTMGREIWKRSQDKKINLDILDGALCFSYLCGYKDGTVTAGGKIYLPEAYINYTNSFYTTITPRSIVDNKWIMFTNILPRRFYYTEEDLAALQRSNEILQQKIKDSERKINEIYKQINER